MQLPQPIHDLYPDLFTAHPLTQAMPELAPTRPNKEAAQQVALATCQLAVAKNPLLAAGLWLYADDLEASHRISQHLPSETASLWHAIMHRREGDFTNSKYWNQQAKNHPLTKELNPTRLLTLVETSSPQALPLQRQEWATLMLHTLQNPES